MTDQSRLAAALAASIVTDPRVLTTADRAASMLRADPGVVCPNPADHDPLAREVRAEGERAKAIHGEPPDRTGLQWLGILTEEVGEVAKEVTQGEVPPVNRPHDEYLRRLRAELVQTASVSMRWLRQVTAALEDKPGPTVEQHVMEDIHR